MPSDLVGPKASATTVGSSDGGAKRKNASPAKNQVGTQMEDVLQLLTQRMEGQVSTTQVESAVSNLLTAMGAGRSAPVKTESADLSSNESKRKNSTATRHNTDPAATSSIQEDDGNYDDSSDDGNEEEDKAGPKKKKQRIHKFNNDNSSQENDLNEIKKKGLPFSSNFANKEDYHDAISQIPMGKEAAKMMTTFGDGHYPLADPLELALMGTRKALQVSIMDARKVRRRLQKEYREAQSIIIKGSGNKYRTSDKSNPTVAAATAWVAEQQEIVNQSPSSPAKMDSSLPTFTPREVNGNSDGESGNESDRNESTISATQTKYQTPSTAATTLPTANSIDPRLLFRALAEGTDKLSYAHKCGFHLEELTHLYPEEMRAYQRWNEMHEEYSESKADDGDGNDGSNNNIKDVNDSNSKRINDEHDRESEGGHLRQRAANFDYRTDKMRDDWYVEYAKVRQGSFLPSSRRVRRTKAEIEWDRLRKIKKGRHAAGEWENISGRAIRFLHWLGFDPPNLYPPDEDTTQALAFLAYDRFGRIIEKATFLRCEKDEKSKSLWELPPGEQLSVQDIERALQDPDIKPATVYGTEDSKTASSVQLYFGPGWEDRLELEMEEMISSLKGNDHRISEEERMVRDHEMELLAKISAPPERNSNHLERLVKKHKENVMMDAKTTDE